MNTSAFGRCCNQPTAFAWKLRIAAREAAIERAVGHYAISREHNITDQECGLSFKTIFDKMAAGSGLGTRLRLRHRKGLGQKVGDTSQVLMMQ